MVDAQKLEQAHERAQAAFADMIEHGTYADPDDPMTRAYIAAERVVDEIMIDLAWAKRKAELDALIAEDFAGDHHIYPAGVGR